MHQRSRLNYLNLLPMSGLHKHIDSLACSNLSVCCSSPCVPCFPLPQSRPAAFILLLRLRSGRCYSSFSFPYLTHSTGMPVDSDAILPHSPTSAIFPLPSLPPECPVCLPHLSSGRTLHNSRESVSSLGVPHLLWLLSTLGIKWKHFTLLFTLCLQT